MSQANVNFELESGPVGMGINKVAQWVDHSEFVDNAQDGRMTLAEQIPAGAFLIGTKVTIEEAVDGDTNTLDVGTAANGTQIASAIDVSSTGIQGEIAATSMQFFTSASDVHLEINEGTDWDNITAGKFLVEVFYLSTVVELNKGYPNKHRSM